jgi:hypothetical protein
MQNYHDLRNLDTSVLENMITAHGANHGKGLSKEECSDCKITIEILRTELASRKQSGPVIPVISPLVKAIKNMLSTGGPDSLPIIYPL